MNKKGIAAVFTLAVLTALLTAAFAWSEQQPVRDPFRYEQEEAKAGAERGAGDEKDEPGKRSKPSVPSGIELKGKMVFHNEDSVAMLKLPLRKKSVFVSENDMLSVEAESEDGQTARYELKIIEINARALKIAPADDSDAIHLIR